MASSLAKLVVSNRSLSMFRPVITCSSRFFNSEPRGDNRDSEDNIPTFTRTCPPFIRDRITQWHHPHFSATQNLNLQLNMMDHLLGVHSEPNDYGRWNVGEDLEGFFLVRSMNHLFERDENDSVPMRNLESLLHLTHFDTPCPNWAVMKEAEELDDFRESTCGMHIISFVRVFCTIRYIPAIYIVVGHEGPDPWDPYGGYIAKISLPRKFYKIEDVVHTYLDGSTWRITVPKKNNEKLIKKIEANFLFFHEIKSKYINES